MKMTFVEESTHNMFYYFFTNIPLLITVGSLIMLGMFFFLTGIAAEKDHSKKISQSLMTIGLIGIASFVLTTIITMGYYSHNSTKGYYKTDTLTIKSIKDEGRGSLKKPKLTVRSSDGKIIGFFDKSHADMLKEGKTYTFYVNKGLYNPYQTERTLHKPIYIGNNTDMIKDKNHIIINKSFVRPDVIRGGIETDRDE